MVSCDNGNNLLAVKVWLGIKPAFNTNYKMETTVGATKKLNFAFVTLVEGGIDFILLSRKIYTPIMNVPHTNIDNLIAFHMFEKYFP